MDEPVVHGSVNALDNDRRNNGMNEPTAARAGLPCDISPHDIVEQKRPESMTVVEEYAREGTLCENNSSGHLGL